MIITIDIFASRKSQAHHVIGVGSFPVEALTDSCKNGSHRFDSLCAFPNSPSPESSPTYFLTAASTKLVPIFDDSHNFGQLWFLVDSSGPSSHASLSCIERGIRNPNNSFILILDWTSACHLRSQINNLASISIPPSSASIRAELHFDRDFFVVRTLATDLSVRIRVGR